MATPGFWVFLCKTTSPIHSPDSLRIFAHFPTGFYAIRDKETRRLMYTPNLVGQWFVKSGEYVFCPGKWKFVGQFQDPGLLWKPSCWCVPQKIQLIINCHTQIFLYCCYWIGCAGLWDRIIALDGFFFQLACVYISWHSASLAKGMSVCRQRQCCFVVVGDPHVFGVEFGIVGEQFHREQFTSSGKSLV